MWCLSIPQVGVVTVTLPLKILGKKVIIILETVRDRDIVTTKD